MRFLANENFPFASVRRLRQNGHDVFAISEKMAGAKDQTVLAKATEEGRIILTFDRDYGELIYKHNLPIPDGIVYFRFEPASPEQPAEYVLQLIATPNLELKGNLRLLNLGKYDKDRFKTPHLPSIDSTHYHFLQ